MKKHALIKYSFVLVFISFCSCMKKNVDISSYKESNVVLKNNEQINIEKKIRYIIKGNDSVIMYRNRYDINNKQIDSISLKMNNKIHCVSFPSLSNFEVNIFKNIPKKKIYNYTNDKFLIVAIYRDILIQYVYNHKENKLENIYIIINTDDVYPESNGKPTDTISKIKIIRVNKLVINIDNNLKRISDSIFNSFEELNLEKKIKSNNIYYVLRKEGIKDYVQ